MTRDNLARYWVEVRSELSKIPNIEVCPTKDDMPDAELWEIEALFIANREANLRMALTIAIGEASNELEEKKGRYGCSFDHPRHSAWTLHRACYSGWASGTLVLIPEGNRHRRMIWSTFFNLGLTLQKTFPEGTNCADVLHDDFSGLWPELDEFMRTYLARRAKYMLDAIKEDGSEFHMHVASPHLWGDVDDLGDNP